MALEWSRGGKIDTILGGRTAAVRPQAVRVSAARLDRFAVGAVLCVSAVLVVFFVFQERRLVGVQGMPLDDAWIHFRVAENLAAGQGFSFNPHEPTSASTSPAWTVALAALYLVTSRIMLSSMALGVLFYLLGNVAVYYLAREVSSSRKVGLVASVLCACTGRWVWSSLSGMETSLFTALTLWGLLFCLRRDATREWPWTVGVALFALAALVRPEGFLLLGLAGLAAVVPVLFGGGFSRATIIRRMTDSGVTSAVCFLVLAAIVRVAYTWGTGGGLAGNTFLAQSLPQGEGPYTGPRFPPDLWYLRAAVRSVVSDDFILGLMVPLGAVYWFRATFTSGTNRRRVLLLAWFVALPLFNSALAPNLRHHERYLMPLIPLAALLGTLGIVLLVRLSIGETPWWRARWRGRWITATVVFLLFATVCLGDALFDARRWAIQYAGDVKSIQAINVKMGEWIRDNTPKDSYVAMNDIGAIAFISERRVLDTVGIAEPGILPYLTSRGREGVFEYLMLKKPDYLVIWPEWYPEMAAMSDVFTPIHSVGIDNPVVATRESMLGGKEMVIYRANWP
jgi:arabinofuranosyltransferase